MSVGLTSQLVIDLVQRPPTQWYLDALYLNHGYYFFAPDPGAGHLIYFDLYNAQGAKIKEGKFPDWDLQRPRLWYHRHFMLAEQIESAFRDEAGQRRVLEAYGRQLLRNYEGESVQVRWVAHEPLDPFRASDPVRLDLPESYKLLLPAVVVRRSDLGPSLEDQTGNWQSGQPAVADRWRTTPR
jgi:hypothetical protein